MQYFNKALIVLILVMYLGILGCSGERANKAESMAVATPVEMITEGMQNSIGLSGFIFGTFILLNAYVLIIASCIVLVIKDNTVEKIIGGLKMTAQMLSSSTEGDKPFLSMLSKLGDHGMRQQLGTAGLAIGIIMAYLGAWIAL